MNRTNEFFMYMNRPPPLIHLNDMLITRCRNKFNEQSLKLDVPKHMSQQMSEHVGNVVLYLKSLDMRSKKCQVMEFKIPSSTIISNIEAPSHISQEYSELLDKETITFEDIITVDLAFGHFVIERQVENISTMIQAYNSLILDQDVKIKSVISPNMNSSLNNYEESIHEINKYRHRTKSVMHLVLLIKGYYFSHRNSNR